MANWVKDQDEKWVNIDNWDFLNYITYEDKNSGQVFCYEIYVKDRNDKSEVLGYVDIKEGDIEDILPRICKGISPNFQTLREIIYWKFDGEWGVTSENFDETNEKANKKIQSLIGKRFVESY